MQKPKSKFVKGMYVAGSNHSPRRPKFYENLALRQGTINVQLSPEAYGSILLPTKRVPGVDKFDFEENQDFLIRPCVLKGVRGYQLLPIDKTTGRPRGLHGGNIIEVSLVMDIDVKCGEELEVELQGYE